jgi:hypothetical protein
MKMPATTVWHGTKENPTEPMGLWGFAMLRDLYYLAESRAFRPLAVIEYTLAPSLSVSAIH